MKKITSNMDRQISFISFDKESVKIGFNEIMPSEKPSVEDEDESELDDVLMNQYTVSSDRKAHKDFLDAMKKLRKFALDLCEMVVDSKLIGDYMVGQVKITGDVLLRQSRVVMRVEKYVKRTDKTIKWATPQVTMYGDGEYGKAEDMSKHIEALIDEAWQYLDGKCGEDTVQLPLFARKELQLK